MQIIIFSLNFNTKLIMLKPNDVAYNPPHILVIVKINNSVIHEAVTIRLNDLQRYGIDLLFLTGSYFPDIRN